jgi:crotonobetainyl-CoA:carnitine CoA-transferase CaiB-like acyl-CoA transferase
MTAARSGLRPLDGLRVLDFTALPPGGACTVLLADLGAEIIRIESPKQKGKPSLVIGQVPLSRGKRSIALDLRQPAANEILTHLAPGVDIVVENAKPGSMEERGFGYAQAKAVHPGIIWCAITGFGQTGPNAEHSGHDLAYLAHSGLLAALAPAGAWHPGSMLAVPAGAQAAVIAIQAALLQRARTGEGAFIDISLSEAAGWFLTCSINPLSDRAYAIPVSPDRRTYRCGDGRYVAVTAAEPRTWGALCDGLGLPGLKDQLHKPETAGTVTATLSAIFATRPAPAWVEQLAPTGAAIALVNQAGQVLDDPQVRARASVLECQGVPVPANPARIVSGGQSSGTALGAPPLIGADTAEVLAQAGYSAEEIAAFGAAGLI